VARRASHGRARVAADPDRRPRLLDWARRDHDVAERDGLAIEARDVRFPGCADGVDVFVGHAPAPVVVGAERGELRLQMTAADAEDHASAREPIERAVLLRHHEGVPVGEHEHVREKLDPRRRTGDEGERAAGVVPDGAHGGGARRRHGDVVAARHPGEPGALRLACYGILPDDPTRVRAHVEEMLREPEVDAIILNGGTGLAPRDRTYEAIVDLLEKRLDGFGELFRMLSYEHVGAAAMLSRAAA